MNNNSFPIGSVFCAKQVVKFLYENYGALAANNFEKAKWPNVYWIDNKAYVRSSDVMAWYLRYFDNHNIHPDTKYWSQPRTVAHQFYVDLECNVNQYINLQPAAVFETLGNILKP